MTTTLQQAVLDALEWLMILNREGIRPKDARSRLPLLQQQHPETELDLVWEEEAYDGSVHYDALLHLPEAGTVSLSFCPAGALPWPLRGVHRWSDADLVRVNDRALKVDQAIACLDFLWNQKRLVERLVDVCLMQEALEKEPSEEISDAELQRAMDSFRRAHGLHTASDTHAWMERHGITHEKLERLVADHTLFPMLRDRVTAGRVEAHFAAAPAEFDTARLARFDLPDEKRARQVSEKIRRGNIEFYEAAELRFLAEEAPPARPLFEVLRRGQTSPQLADAIFAAAPGEVVGPVRVEEGYALVRVLSITPACLDERTRTAIQEILFADWLAERRRAATIEWCWGNARQTSEAV